MPTLHAERRAFTSSDESVLTVIQNPDNPAMLHAVAPVAPTGG